MISEVLSLFIKSLTIDPHRRIAGESIRQEGERVVSDILPTDLWTEILVRLPVRTLLTLRCVSKYFLSFIQNPNFTSLRFSLFNNLSSESNVNDLLLLQRSGSSSFNVYRGDKSKKKVEFAISIDSGGDVVDYVNGLLWLHGLNSSIKYMMLCNPSIRKSLMIPPSPALDLGRSYLGFGYDPNTDDYKVVVIVHVGSDPQYNFQFLARTLVEVYSHKMGSWRSLGFDLISGKWDLGKSLYANGSIHWLACVYGSEYVFDTKLLSVSHLVSFDLGTEVFSYRELPKFDELDGLSDQGILKLPFSIHGFLAVLYISCKYICVSVLKEDGWIKEHIIDSSLSGFYGYLSRTYYNLGRATDRINSVILCEWSGELIIAAKDEGLIFYNIKTHKFRTSHYGVSYVGRYVENLLWRE